jgi:hypothetical protein
MRIVLDPDDAVTVAKAMAKSRGLTLNFDRPYRPDSMEDQIYHEALRVITALTQQPATICLAR